MQLENNSLKEQNQELQKTIQNIQDQYKDAISSLELDLKRLKQEEKQTAGEIFVQQEQVDRALISHQEELEQLRAQHTL